MGGGNETFTGYRDEAALALIPAPSIKHLMRQYDSVPCCTVLLDSLPQPSQTSTARTHCATLMPAEMLLAFLHLVL